MRNIDLSPLHRFAVGFDRMQRQMDQALSMDEASQSYPPYNIEAISEDAYRITMAVAGFAEDDLDVNIKEDTLVITGKSSNTNEGATYLHHGIAGRSFERRFELADHIKVIGASMENGLLNIDLERQIPEERKPRSIKIKAGTGATRIESKAA